MRSPATNSRAYSIWLSVLNKDCEPLAAVTVRSVTFWQWRIFPSLMILSKSDPRDGLLPLFLVEHEGREEWFYSEKERLEYFAAHNLPVFTELETQSNSTPDLAGHGKPIREGCCGYLLFFKSSCA